MNNKIFVSASLFPQFYGTWIYRIYNFLLTREDQIQKTLNDYSKNSGNKILNQIDFCEQMSHSIRTFFNLNVNPFMNNVVRWPKIL